MLHIGSGHSGKKHKTENHLTKNRKTIFPNAMKKSLCRFIFSSTSLIGTEVQSFCPVILTTVKINSCFTSCLTAD